MAEKMTSGKVSINLLGIEAVKISDERRTIYIDAFANGVELHDVKRADYIFVTHDDGDHFSAPKVAEAAKTMDSTIIGPPSIAYPLLVHEGIPPEKLAIFYPKQFKKPLVKEMPGLRFKVYNAKHDGDWNPIHVSYFIEFAGKRFYHTGDSSLVNQDDPELKRLDALFYVYNSRDPSGINTFQELQRRLAPKRIVPIHLLKCRWTFTVNEFKKELQKRDVGNANVVVLDENDALIIE